MRRSSSVFCSVDKLFWLLHNSLQTQWTEDSTKSKYPNKRRDKCFLTSVTQYMDTVTDELL